MRSSRRRLPRWGAVPAIAVAGVMAVVAAAGPAVADDTNGSLTVHVTTSTGAPARFADVMLMTTDGIGQSERFTETDGSYRFDDVRPGSYKVMFNYDGVTQYAHQKLDFASGDVFTVTGGANTDVDEQMFAPGGIDVKVVDSGSGEPVDTACVTLVFHGSENCAPDAGVFHFTDLGRAADYRVDARAQDGLHMPGQVTGVAVELGKTTQVTVKLDPAAVITTTVLDRATRRPVPYTCVSALTRYFQGIESGYCTATDQHENPVAESDTDGTVRIGEIPAGERRLFVQPEDGDHGIQWVGAHGGTGSQYTARKIDVVPGTVSALPPILLDPPGSLSGRFTDAGGGAPDIVSGCAITMPQPYNGLAPGSSCGSQDGTFTISGLGPYKWPVGFSDPWGSPYGTQWPGGHHLDRASAPTHQVTAGTTTDIGVERLTEGRTLSGSVLGGDGRPWPGYAYVSAYDARTGDYLGESPESGDYRISPLAPPSVKLLVTADGYGTFWYPGATTFEEGAPVPLPSGRDRRLDIVVPSH